MRDAEGSDKSFSETNSAEPSRRQSDPKRKRFGAIGQELSA
ncbi:hypothetical protein S7335_3735 [Synechococcus sp. PCC 7335]|nr:hypothetical protein S7335_3735 [Synechococcus sp. PCC 7335]